LVFHVEGQSCTSRITLLRTAGRSENKKRGFNKTLAFGKGL
jgi:hypothetical protein